MGSKNRIAQKLRQNDEHRAITRFLDGADLRYTIHPPPGCQHPYLMIALPDGATIKHTVACTPKGGGAPKKALALLRRHLWEVGYDC